MNEENLIQKLLKQLKERGRFNSPEEVEEYFAEALKLSYQEGVKKGLAEKEKIDETEGRTYPSESVNGLYSGMTNVKAINHNNQNNNEQL